MKLTLILSDCQFPFRVKTIPQIQENDMKLTKLTTIFKLRYQTLKRLTLTDKEL